MCTLSALNCLGFKHVRLLRIAILINQLCKSEVGVVIGIDGYAHYAAGSAATRIILSVLYKRYYWGEAPH